jgi:16S rRNA (cytosine1402-N4)-methyltransferase
MTSISNAFASNSGSEGNVNGNRNDAHRAVLIQEAVEALLTDPSGVYVDGTFGRGGHAGAVLSRLSEKGRLIALDRDPDAVAYAGREAVFAGDGRLSMTHAAFSMWGQVLNDAGYAQADGLLLDVGVSSPQIDDPMRGFSFRFDAPLDMRMDPTRGLSAAEFIQAATQQRLTEVIRDYGEERFAAPIAKALVMRRDSGHPVQTTRELAEVVAQTVKTREGGQNPATRTFQALRIVVNAELEELRQALETALTHLKTGGRLVVISFHSLEDRIVKTFMHRHSRQEVDRRALFAPPRPMLLRVLSRLRPSEEEVRDNPRARSAILRVAERTEVTL